MDPNGLPRLDYGDDRGRSKLRHAKSSQFFIRWLKKKRISNEKLSSGDRLEAMKAVIGGVLADENVSAILVSRKHSAYEISQRGDQPGRHRKQQWFSLAKIHDHPFPLRLASKVKGSRQRAAITPAPSQLTFGFLENIL